MHDTPKVGDRFVYRDDDQVWEVTRIALGQIYHATVEDADKQRADGRVPVGPWSVPLTMFNGQVLPRG